MSKLQEKIDLYTESAEKLGIAIEADLFKLVAKGLGPSIYKEDAELVSSSNETELETVKNYMAGSFISSINTPFALADLYRSVWFQGLPEDWYDSMVSRIRGVTAERLHELAQVYFSEPMTEIRVG